MAGEENTPYWEIAGLALSVLQMGIYLKMLRDYEKKLLDYASNLNSWADQDKSAYIFFRDADPSFYSYYTSLPDYDVCEASTRRVMGAGFHAYGKTLRSTIGVTRGYTPLVKAHANALIADNSHAVSSSAMMMASVITAERRRKMEHSMERWRAIIDAPVGVERYSPAPLQSVISQTFKSVTSFAQGFNSAGTAFGTQLYKVL